MRLRGSTGIYDAILGVRPRRPSRRQLTQTQIRRLERHDDC